MRLPKAFRFEGTHVLVSRAGSTVILEPADEVAWPAGYWEALDASGPVTDDFGVPEPLPASPHRDHALDQLDGDEGR